MANNGTHPNADRPQTDIIALALAAIPTIYVADVLAEVARRHVEATGAPLPAVTVLPNGHIVTMRGDREPHPGDYSDDHDDAGWRVMLDTNAVNLTGHYAGEYVPHNHD